MDGFEEGPEYRPSVHSQGVRAWKQKKWSIPNFPCSLTINTTTHSMKNLAFHRSLRWKMIILRILIASLIHFYLKGWENVLFELGSERSRCVPHPKSLWQISCRSVWGPWGFPVSSNPGSCSRIPEVKKHWDQAMETDRESYINIGLGDQ